MHDLIHYNKTNEIQSVNPNRNLIDETVEKRPTKKNQLKSIKKIVSSVKRKTTKKNLI